MSSAAGAANRAFGLDRGMPFPLSDIAEADVVVLVGSNPADTMPPAMQYFDAGRASGAQHVVVDPRRTATARNAALHLQPLPGTDLALANGLLHIALAEGLVDEAYVAARTTGFEAVREGVGAYWPDRVERLTGVPVPPSGAPSFALARAEKAIVLTARGAEQHRSGTDTAQAWINLALALGCPGRPGSGWGTVTGQGNGQGGREHGQKADQLPGYRSLKDPAARAHVAAVWGIDPDDLPCPGRSAFELLDALGTDGGVRTLLVLASNVAVSAPDARRVDQPAERPRLPRRQRLLPLRDRRARRRRPAPRHVGGGGRHDDQPRGPGHPAPQGARPAVRRPRRPPAARDAGRAARRRRRFSGDPRDGLRGAAPGQRRGSGRLLRDQLPADRRRAGRLLALPGDDAPGHAATVRRPVRHPDGRARFVRVDTSTPTSAPTPTTRTC